MHHESHPDVVWIRKSDPQPDTCCHCGSFTDKRVTVKHVEMVPKTGQSSGGATVVALTLLLHIGLGPIGWLFSAMMEGDEAENSDKLVKQKSKIKIAQCPLCYGMQPPEFLESNDGSHALHVHPKFKQGFDNLQKPGTS